MSIINLYKHYPFFKEDCFVEVTDEIRTQEIRDTLCRSASKDNDVRKFISEIRQCASIRKLISHLIQQMVCIVDVHVRICS
jgi:predicted AlkP superfamily phosphohydrolase/phosphomutase